MKHMMRTGVLILGFLLIFAGSSAARSKDKIVFGVPAWPGVTVKTEVISQLVKAMGHGVKQTTASPSIIFRSLTANDMQIFLGGWSPLEDPMIDPLVAEKKINKVGKNIQGAVTSLAVPSYVAEAGISSIEDLDRHKENFNGTIYSIEPGTGISKDLNAAVKKDAAGLGDWKLKETSTAIMIAEAMSHVEQKEWIVFFGWEPHWMNVVMDICYLESKTTPTADIGATESIVYTITSTALPNTHPQVYRFMQQIKVPNQVQSAWIYEYKQNKQKPEEVASEWIKANLNGLVAQWTEGVSAKDGRPAIEVIREGLQ